MNTDLSHILAYAFPGQRSNYDTIDRSDGQGVQIARWDANAIGAPQPTEADVVAIEALPAYQQYKAAHGGDPVLTARRQASESLNASLNAASMVDRVLAEATRDELNNLRQWITGFKAAVAAAANLADLKTRVAALPNTPDRTKQQLRTLAENKLSAGEGDN